MIRVALLLCLAASSAFALLEKGLLVKFEDNTPEYGITAFMPMPTTVTEAKEKGWVKVENPSVATEYNASLLDLYCPVGDKTLCTLYDNTEYIAALQLAFDPNLYQNTFYDWNESGFLDWTITEDGVTTTYKVAHQYYLSPKDLQTDPSERIASRDEKYLVQRNVYVEGRNGELMTIPKSVDELIANNYVKQACIDVMGTHYMINMTKDFNCDEDIVFKWVVLEHEDRIVGVQFFYMGKWPIAEGKTNYFEIPGTEDLKTIVTQSPECLYKYGDEPGLLSIHIYFVNDPYSIKC